MLGRSAMIGLASCAVALLAPAAAPAWQRLPDASAPRTVFELSLAARDDGALALATGNGETRVRTLRRGASAWRAAQRYPRLLNHALLGGAAFTLLGEKDIEPGDPDSFSQVFAASQRSDGRGLRSARRLDRRPRWHAESFSLRAATNRAGRGIVTWYASRGSTPERSIATIQRRRGSRGQLIAERALDSPCAAAVNDRGDVLLVGDSEDYRKGLFAQTWYADGRRSRRSYLPIPDCEFVTAALADNGAAVIAGTSLEYDVGVSGDPIAQPVEAVVRRRWGPFGRTRVLGTGATANEVDERPVISAALDERGRGLIAWRGLSTPALAVNRVRGGRIGRRRVLSPGPQEAQLVGTASVDGRVAVAWGPIEQGSDTRPMDGPGELRVTSGRAGSSRLSTERVVEFPPGVYMEDATLLVSPRERLHLGWLTIGTERSVIGVARRRFP